MFVKFMQAYKIKPYKLSYPNSMQITYTPVKHIVFKKGFLSYNLKQRFRIQLKY